MNMTKWRSSLIMIVAWPWPVVVRDRGATGQANASCSSWMINTSCPPRSRSLLQMQVLVAGWPIMMVVGWPIVVGWPRVVGSGHLCHSVWWPVRMSTVAGGVHGLTEKEGGSRNSKAGQWVQWLSNVTVALAQYGDQDFFLVRSVLSLPTRLSKPHA